MDITLFLILFTVCEVLTPLVVEGIKAEFKGIGKSYNATLIALIVSIVVSGLCGIFAYMAKGIDFTVVNVFYIGFLMAANWLGSTLGYDKIKQTLTNIKSIDATDVTKE
ncbi:hypothetical protein [Anaerocolumna xylanovorans]|uniref:Uncharacterized protein n=1 Tax=Anaerocolumna xylanovorans DSM 12503 TaxID=1121345 RepID=A0A1M7YM82_9FIRM|nr:hypothetical protein [Anaerocolumna xylanovorans]SHO53714.1 hypothetical protein SAMN02745217_04253 [Anaerocolumna xylanovorans DSM 12503]